MNWTNFIDYLLGLEETSSACSEAPQPLRAYGLLSNDFVFRFRCQKCGVRCCLNLNYNLIFPPYSFAYIRRVIPKNTLDVCFQQGFLEWIVHPRTSPYIKVQSFVCPFLILWWNPKTINLFQQNLEHVADSLSPDVQLFLADTLKSLTTMFYDHLKDTKHSNMMLNVNGLLFILLEVWDQLSYNRPDLFADDSKNKCVTTFYEFLQNPPLVKTQFQASCLIWPARPNSCRAFPLYRWWIPDTGQEECDSPQASLEEAICPPQVFQKGDTKTVDSFLQEQGIDDSESLILDKIDAIIQQYDELLRSSSPEEVDLFYQRLIHELYYSTEFTFDMELFYQGLLDTLNEFFQDLSDRYQSFITS